MYMFSGCLPNLQIDKIVGVAVDSWLIVGSEKGPHNSQSPVHVGKERHIIMYLATGGFAQPSDSWWGPQFCRTGWKHEAATVGNRSVSHGSLAQCNLDTV